MWIKMLETRKGSEDGFAVQQFYKDKEYDVRDHLAYMFFASGFAVRQKKIEPEVQN